MADARVTMSIEAVLHEAMRTFLQTALDVHGVRIDAMEVTWLSAATADKPERAIVKSLQLTTATGG
jgi:hypothetical protein